MKLLRATLFSIATLSSIAQASDWHLFSAGTDKTGNAQIALYDAESMSRHGGKVRVWLKYVPSDAISTEPDQRLVPEITRRLKAKADPDLLLVPSAARLDEPRDTIRLYAIVVEQTVQQTEVIADSVMQVDIGCANRTVQLLALTNYAPDGSVKNTMERPRGVSPITPDTHIEDLHRLLCVLKRR